MTAKPAKPDRYTVDKVGTPDPAASQYYVLDVVHDFRAREVVAQLGNKYRADNAKVKAEECFELLNSTLEAHRAVMELRNPKTKKKSKVDKENMHA